MFERLIDFDPEVQDTAAGIMPVDQAAPVEVINAQLNTAEWLTDLGADSDAAVDGEIARAHAQQAFAMLTTPNPHHGQRNALLQLKTPAAVQHLTGMLTAYDWEFIEQARQLRGYAVAKILEETNNANPSIRIKALALLGKVTEVGLFTEKIEVTKTDLSEADLDARIKEKLDRIRGVVDVKAQPIDDVEPLDDDEA